MSVRANPTVIGAFVLGAGIVLVAGLLFWGGTGLFKRKLHWVMYFDSAVTGLQKGAPVLMRGVRIGEVKDIQIRWGKSLVGVYADMEPDNFHGVPPSDVPAATQVAIKERSIRAQLRPQSFVTGVLYVVVGWMMVNNPQESALLLTLIIAMFLVFEGVFRIVAAIAVRYPHWGSVLFNGVISLLLGILIWRRWPVSGLWAIGLFVGIEMLLNGWSLVMLSIAGRNLPEEVSAGRRP